MELQSVPKRPERPPVYLIHAGKVIDKPSRIAIVDEIDMTVMSPIRVIYEFFAGKCDEGFMESPKSSAAITNTFFSSLEKWGQLSRYL